MGLALDEILHRPDVLILVVAAAAALLATFVVVLRRRKSPEEVERERRDVVNRHGRLSDATVTEIDESAISFNYSVAGVEYHATQCISSITNPLRRDAHNALGPATVKYLPNNPANSIILCESWSGLRENGSKWHSSGAGDGLSARARAPQAVEDRHPFG